MTADSTVAHLSDEALDRLTKALENHTAMLEKASAAGGSGGSGGPPPSATSLTATQVEGLDAAFRYRLLRTLMSATRVDEVTARVERHNRGLRVTAQPPGALVSHLALLGEADGDDDCDPAPRVRAVLPLSSGRVTAAALREAGVDVDGAFGDLRLLAGPAGPVVAVAPPIPVPTDSHPDVH